MLAGKKERVMGGGVESRAQNYSRRIKISLRCGNNEQVDLNKEVAQSYIKCFYDYLLSTFFSLNKLNC
jgi:hypothetical protein